MLVHYDRRLLEIAVPEQSWSHLAKAATFEILTDEEIAHYHARAA